MRRQPLGRARKEPKRAFKGLSLFKARQARASEEIFNVNQPDLARRVTYPGRPERAASKAARVCRREGGPRLEEGSCPAEAKLWRVSIDNKGVCWQRRGQASTPQTSYLCSLGLFGRGCTRALLSWAVITNKHVCGFAVYPGRRIIPTHQH